MITGFEKIVEERIRQAQKKGEFDNLEGSGRPLEFPDDQHVSEDLRLSYKILKNADCVPPEVEAKKEIKRAEDLLADLKDEKEKHKILKKINFLTLKINSMRNTPIAFEVPQRYMENIVNRMDSDPSVKEKK